jgi:hypothetical protein
MVSSFLALLYRYEIARSFRCAQTQDLRARWNHGELFGARPPMLVGLRDMEIHPAAEMGKTTPSARAVGPGSLHLRTGVRLKKVMVLLIYAP